MEGYLNINLHKREWSQILPPDTRVWVKVARYACDTPNRQLFRIWPCVYIAWKDLVLIGKLASSQCSKFPVFSQSRTQSHYCIMVSSKLFFRKTESKAKNGGIFTSSARPLTLFFSARSVTSNEGCAAQKEVWHWTSNPAIFIAIFGFTFNFGREVLPSYSRYI